MSMLKAKLAQQIPDLREDIRTLVKGHAEHKISDVTVAQAYGVWGEKSMLGKKFMGIIRSSFLIDEQGVIVKAWYKVKPKETVPLAQEAAG